MLLWMTLHIESGSNIHVKDQFVKINCEQTALQYGEKSLRNPKLVLNFIE